MNVRRTLVLSTAACAALATLWSAGTARPAAPAVNHRYRVTVTNVTKGQIFAPTLIVAHDSSARLFELGAPASPGLAHLAEEGDPSLVEAELTMLNGVRWVGDSGAALMPGQSMTTTVLTDSDHPYFSVAGMLVSTNDGFFALRDVPAPQMKSTHLARAYDAGSERNSEDCAFVPGPPCGNHVHDAAPAEGYVRIHEGIHGQGNLAPEDFDWNGEVAQVTFERVGP
ncbi:MAG: spondin domain-containing protein [Planctomycetes bacterium]|nr:spondin domain-containing protein [Planctomycetota bacterium]